MKAKTIFWTIAAVALTASILVSSSYAKTQAQPAAPAAAPAAKNVQATAAAQAFQGSKAWNKVDPDLQTAWLAAINNNDQDKRFDCFVRVEAPFDRGDESFLVSKGFIVQQAAGSVATGHLTTKDLQDVAELPFVRSIKLAK